jgi:DNA-binding transcriptional ArsR family regulator
MVNRAARGGKCGAAGGGKNGGKISLDIFPYEHVLLFSMARAATTSDPFNAIAEPRRRQILIYLAREERQVGEIVTAIGLDQPSVSKHLGVLRKVNLVRVRRNGRHRLYRTNAAAIRPLHEWTETFERYWQHQLNRVKERAEAQAQRDQSPQDRARN